MWENGSDGAIDVTNPENGKVFTAIATDRTEDKGAKGEVILWWLESIGHRFQGRQGRNGLIPEHQIPFYRRH